MGVLEVISDWLLDSKKPLIQNRLAFNEAAAEECRARPADPSYTRYDPHHAALALEDLHLSDHLKEI